MSDFNPDRRRIITGVAGPHCCRSSARLPAVQVSIIRSRWAWRLVIRCRTAS